MDLDALLAPRTGEAPSGGNLEYDDAFVAMEIAARPVGERQAGSVILDAEDPDFADVARKALAVMERSHDLRAGATLAGALIFTEGLPGFAAAVGYVRGCLERYWDTCHPQLDADDDNDPTMRINSVQALAAPDPVLRGLRGTPLTQSRAFGRATLRDVLVAQGQLALPEGETAAFDSAAVDAAFRDTDGALLAATLDSARSALDGLVAIERIFAERTPGQGPQLAEAAKLLRQIVQAISAATGGAAEAAGPDPDADQPGDAPAAAVRGAPGQIASQADVLRALDAIIGYYRVAEPSSPVPLILQRARRLVGADFLAIVKDMAPNGLDNVRLVGGLGYDE